MKIELIESERKHLLSLLKWNRREGIYQGSEVQYRKRELNLIKKMQGLNQEKEEKRDKGIESI